MCAPAVFRDVGSNMANLDVGERLANRNDVRLVFWGVGARLVFRDVLRLGLKIAAASVAYRCEPTGAHCRFGRVLALQVDHGHENVCWSESGAAPSCRVDAGQ